MVVCQKHERHFKKSNKHSIKTFKTYSECMSEVLKTHQEIQQTFNQNVQDISWKYVRSIKDTTRNLTNIQSKRSRHIMEICQNY